MLSHQSWRSFSSNKDRPKILQHCTAVAYSKAINDGIFQLPQPSTKFLHQETQHNNKTKKSILQQRHRGTDQIRLLTHLYHCPKRHFYTKVRLKAYEFALYSQGTICRSTFITMSKKQERIAEYNNNIRKKFKEHGIRHIQLGKGKSDYVCTHCKEAANIIKDCNQRGEEMLSLEEQCIIDAVIEMPYWTSPSAIRSLNLRFNCIQTPAIRFLTKIKWPFLHSLILESNFIEAEGAQLIATSHFQNLATLILSENMIMYEGCCMLAKANFAKSLFRLRLRRIGLSIEDPITNELGNFVNLQQLDLQNPLSRKAVKTLVGTSLKGLTNLNLTSCKIDDEGSTQLSKGRWEGLSIMDVKSNSITNRGMRILVSGNWPQLRQLSATLEDNFMTMFRILAKTNSPFKIQCNIAHSEPYLEAIDAYLLNYKCLNKKMELLQY